MAIHCSDIETLVNTYLDGELADDDACEFEAHTEDCAGCHERLEHEIEFRTELRRKLAPPRMPDELPARLMAALDQEDAALQQASRRRGLSWVLPGVASLAAAAALLLFVTYDPQAPAVEEPVTHEAVKAHLRQPPIEVQGAASQVSPWISRHFQHGVEPPRFSSTDINLRGARLSHLRGRDAAQLFYEARRGSQRHEVQVHILDGSDLELRGTHRRVGGRDLYVDGNLGYSIVTYKDPHGGMVYVFTSDMSARDLLDLVVNSDLLLKASERAP